VGFISLTRSSAYSPTWAWGFFTVAVGKLALSKKDKNAYAIASFKFIFNFVFW